MDKFEEYKFFAESTQHLSDRRQNATQIYLAVNTAIFTVMAFLVKDVDFLGESLIYFNTPLFIVGVLACLIWYQIIAQYKALIGWRYDQLMEMEKLLADSYQMFIKEWEDFFKPQKDKEKFGFSRLEIWLPWLFLGLYAIYGITLMLVNYL